MAWLYSSLALTALLITAPGLLNYMILTVKHKRFSRSDYLYHHMYALYTCAYRRLICLRVIL